MLPHSVIFVFISAVMAALTIPMVRRRVPPNAAYGLRVRATFADEWVWYEANEKSGRDLLYVSIALGVLAVGLALVPGISEDTYLALWVGALLLGTLGATVVGARRANRLLRERRGEK